MNVVPWLLTAIAIGVAAALFVENRETERQRDALDQQLERARTAALALEKVRAKEEEARRTLESARQAERAAARKAEASARSAAAAAQGAEKAARAAQKQAEAASRAAERVAAEKDLADRLVTEKAALEAQRDRIAIEKARAEIERSRAEQFAAEAKAAAERARQPKVTYITSGEARKKAMDLEAEGRGHEALRIYIAAARSGDCEAAARLGEIYDKGLVGVARNYAESLKWYNAARVLGCEVPLPLSRVKPPAVYTD